MISSSHFVRTQEAARLLKLSDRTLEKYRLNGTGPKYSKIGGRIIYAVSDLIAWVELSDGPTADPDKTPFPKHDSFVAIEQLTTLETARFLGLSRRTVEKYRTQGTGPKYSKLDGRIIYTVSDLMEWIDNRSTTPLPNHGDFVAEIETAQPEQLYTREAARFLGLSYRRLEKYRTRGTGPKYSKAGRRVVYAISDLQEWVQRRARRLRSDSGKTTARPAAPVSEHSIKPNEAVQ